MIFEVPLEHFPLNSNKMGLAQRRSANPPAITISRADTKQMEPLSPSVRRAQFSFSGLRLPRMLDRQQSQSMPSLIQLSSSAPSSESSTAASTPAQERPRKASFELRPIQLNIQLPQLRFFSTPFLNKL